MYCKQSRWYFGYLLLYCLAAKLNVNLAEPVTLESPQRICYYRNEGTSYTSVYLRRYDLHERRVLSSFK
jgi:hypothetical protein